MKYTIVFIYVLANMLLPNTNLLSISIVYNFRIAQITKQPITENTTQNHMLSGLAFDVYQKKYTPGISQNFAGGLASYIYNFKPYYFRTDFAASHIRENDHHTTTFSGAQTDDILFTIGRNAKINDHNIVTLSGLFGIPTHKTLALQHVDFGYGQVGTGVQLDGAYTFHQNNSFVYGARYIYFVPRKACDDLGKKHTFTIGNIGDILVAYKKNWTKHGLEFGYTARSQFGAHISPSLDEIVQKTNYVRSSFYAVYKYKFFIKNISNRLLFNIAYGFDHRPKTFGNKYIITVWAAWNINF